MVPVRQCADRVRRHTCWGIGVLRGGWTPVTMTEYVSTRSPLVAKRVRDHLGWGCKCGGGAYAWEVAGPT